MDRNDVEEVFRRNRLLDEYQRQRALAVWPEIVGEGIARYTRPESLQGGTLRIRVASAAAAHELSMLADQHRVRLNHRLGGAIVRRIDYEVGPLPRAPRPVPIPADPPPEPTAVFEDLDDERLARGFTRIYAAQARRDAGLLAAGGVRCPRCGVVHRSGGRECPGCRYDGGEIETGRDPD